MQSTPHYITDKPLNYEEIRTIFEQNQRLALPDATITKIENSRNYLNKKIAEEEGPLYGITTGFGSLCDRSISNSQLAKLQENLLLSHAVGVGEEVNPEIVKMMMLLKIHALAYGNSGVQYATVQRIVDMFNEDIIPVVFEKGSLGASGDLAPLAHTFLPLLGLGEVNYKGQRYQSADMLKKLNWSPLKLQSKEGLALLNGTQFMSAHGIRAILKAKRLHKVADLVAAVSLESFDGLLEPFLQKVQEIRPHKGQTDTASAFRQILEGSEMMHRKKSYVQDPYSFRCIPQVHGASKDAVRYVSEVLLTEINSVTDNPTLLPDEDRIVSGGNFHGEPLAINFDYLSIALAELGNISERRIYRLIAGERGLPEFLVVNPGLNSGFMIPQYTAAALVNQNKQLAMPSSVDSIPSSNEQEDHVSMGANAATKLLRIIDNVEYILAIEFYNAAQALEFRRPRKSSGLIEKLMSAYRNEVTFVTEDTFMHEDIEKTNTFLYSTQVRELIGDHLYDEYNI